VELRLSEVYSKRQSTWDMGAR